MSVVVVRILEEAEDDLLSILRNLRRVKGRHREEKNFYDIFFNFPSFLSLSTYTMELEGFSYRRKFCGGGGSGRDDDGTQSITLHDKRIFGGEKKIKEDLTHSSQLSIKWLTINVKWRILRCCLFSLNKPARRRRFE